MAAQIFSLFDRAPRIARDWSQQELAEFYRVESALLQAGVRLESDRGLSDEGDPWFVFCRADSGDVFPHFALIDGLYVADGAAFQEPARGPDFGALVRALIAQYPLAQARERAGSNIFVHPAAFLIALVGAAFFHSNDVKAAETHDVVKAVPRRASLIVVSQLSSPVAAGGLAVTADLSTTQAAAVILSAVLSLHDDVFAAPRDLSPSSGMALDLAMAVAPAPALWSQTDAPTILHDAGSAMVVLGVQLETSRYGQVAMPEDGPVDLTSRAAVILAPSGPVTAELSSEIVGRSDATSTPSATGEALKPHLLFTAANAPPENAVPTEAAATATAAAAEAGGAYNLAVKAVTQVDRLPSNLLDLINRGEHLSAWTTIAGAPVTQAPDGMHVTEATPGAPVAVANPRTHDPAIDTAIAQFVSHVSHLEVVQQGQALILYDHDIFSALMPDLNLASVTFTFEDGSSVSLVGTAADLSIFS